MLKSYENIRVFAWTTSHVYKGGITFSGRASRFSLTNFIYNKYFKYTVYVLQCRDKTSYFAVPYRIIALYNSFA